MNIKSAIVSVASTGGAGSAAYRLHTALSKYSQVQSSFVSQVTMATDIIDKHSYVVSPEQYSYSYRLKSKLGLDTNSINNKRHKIIDNCDCEIATLPDTNYRIDKFEVLDQMDIINLHWVADFLDYPSFFRKVSKPIVWTIHDMNPFSGIFHYEGDQLYNKIIANNLDKRVLNEKIRAIHCSRNLHIVSPSNWLKEKSENSLAFRKYPHYVIPNGLNMNDYPLLSATGSKSKYDLNNGRKTLLFVAHDMKVRRKGFDLLFAAIKLLDSTEYNLITVGGDKIPFNNDITHVHFDRIYDSTQLNELYSAADLTILPSREDNLPNVMLESFSNGVPVIAFANGGMSEHIITGENGILLTEISESSLAKSLIQFFNHQYTFDRVAIQEYAIKHFSAQKQAQAYSNLYQSILT